MSRIKKRGLDYFPLNTDFIHDRLVRRILKREGDASLAVLFQAICSIYSGEGYYVEADTLFYDDLADSLYQQEPADVERIIRLAVEYGLFDARLFNECHVLTSADIQRQFLFITKRRNSTVIDARYNLLPAAPPAEETPECATEDAPAKKATEEAPNVSESTVSATFQSENREKEPSGTQSIAKESTEKQKIENSLLYSSPESGGTEGADETSAEEAYLRKIEFMKAPQDGFRHNLDGLIINLRELRISAQEQYAIIIKSNFGVIGHPLWRGFYTLRESHGKIRQPGRYLLSLCKSATGQAAKSQ